MKILIGDYDIKRLKLLKTSYHTRKHLNKNTICEIFNEEEWIELDDVTFLKERFFKETMISEYDIIFCRRSSRIIGENIFNFTDGVCENIIKNKVITANSFYRYFILFLVYGKLKKYDYKVLTNAYQLFNNIGISNGDINYLID
jgi:hypothetical protein